MVNRGNSATPCSNATATHGRAQASSAAPGANLTGVSKFILPLPRTDITNRSRFIWRTAPPAQRNAHFCGRQRRLLCAVAPPCRHLTRQTA
ncbi:hypothetical protein KCP73_19250 [Salmonella enterica subsp. enterica]|nr:hypothetical protein KCP73_19250 [Salmonella enterica subsp. enterica]